MEMHEVFFTTLYDRLATGLEAINGETKNILTLTGKSIDAVRASIAELKQHVLKNEFASSSEEVRFFRYIKPKFYSLLLYHAKVYEIELNRPAGGLSSEIEYLKKEELKLYHFYENNREFYQYIRSGSNYLDDRYFVRSSENTIGAVMGYEYEIDPKFTTGYDHIVSKIGANERLREYFENALLRLLPEKNDLSIAASVKSNDLVWTASKISLVELFYGLQSAGVFNNGTVGLQEVADFCEKKFNMRLGNYYRAFQEIRTRKNRTKFLDEVKEKLTLKMDFWDDNPR